MYYIISYHAKQQIYTQFSKLLVNTRSFNVQVVTNVYAFLEDNCVMFNQLIMCM